MTRRRRASGHEALSRWEGKDQVVSYGGLDFRIQRDGESTLTATCSSCSAKVKGLSGVKLKAFYVEHFKLHMPQAPAEKETIDIEQLIADIRELDELKADGDELAVLGIIVSRLKGGLKVYGKLHIDTDERDFEQEALEEAADGMIYSAIGIARRRRRARNGR